MDIEKLKELADHYQRIARGLYIRDKVYFPMMYAIAEDYRVTPVGLASEDENDKIEIKEMMDAVKDECESIFLILNMNFIDYKDEKPENIPDTVDENDPRAASAIVCFLYTKDISLMRLFRYAKEGDEVSFIEQGWQDNDELSGNFLNPFKKS